MLCVMTPDETTDEKKSSRSYWGFVLSSILLLGSFAVLVGCTTPWDAVKDYAEEPHPPKAVVDDVQKYIEAKGIPRSDISEVRYGVDAQGRRAGRVIEE